MKRSLSLLVCFLFVAQSLEIASGNSYEIPSDVQGAGGGDDARSTNYKLIDTIGEPNIGVSDSTNYKLRAGYRQGGGSDSTISISGPTTLSIGTIAGAGQATGSGTWTVITDNDAGYQLAWTAYAGTGTTNQNLAMHWKFDETSGTTAADDTGTANAAHQNGSVISTDTAPQDFVNVRSLRFDGSNDHATFTRQTLLTGLTYATWVKTISTDATANYSGNAAQNILGDSTAAVVVGFGIHAGKVRYNHNDGSWQSVSSTTSVNDGEWHHIAVTHNQTTGTVTMYVDGIADGTGNITYNTSNTAVDRISKGRENGANTGDHFTGTLDDLHVYNTPVAISVIKQLAADPPAGSLVSENGDEVYAYVPPSTTNLIGYWPLNETSGVTAYDASGNNYDGTYTGTTTSSSTPNVNIRNAASRNFDGVDDHVEINAVALDLSNTFTMSAWVKVPTPSGGDEWLLLSWGENVTGKRRSLWIQNTTGYLHFSGYNADVTSTTVVGDDAWHHVAATVTAGNLVKLYVDGIEVSSGTPSLASYTYGGTFIGTSEVATEYTQGLIDDVRIYSSVLVPADIKGLASLPQTWSVAASASAWGARLSSTSADTHAKWGTDGGTENWLAVGNGSYVINTRTSRTGISGSSQKIYFRSEVGSTNNQPTGTYNGTVVLTATTL